MAKRFCKRPWGWWLVVLDRKHFKVKLLRFKRGGKLSNQYHQHRKELWLILSGTGMMIGPDESDYLLMEPGDAHLVYEMQRHEFEAWRTTWVLEVQYGQRCDERDIYRV